MRTVPVRSGCVQAAPWADGSDWSDHDCPARDLSPVCRGAGRRSRLALVPATREAPLCAGGRARCRRGRHPGQAARGALDRPPALRRRPHHALDRAQRRQRVPVRPHCPGHRDRARGPHPQPRWSAPCCSCSRSCSASPEWRHTCTTCRTSSGGWVRAWWQQRPGSRWLASSPHRSTVGGPPSPERSPSAEAGGPRPAYDQRPVTEGSRGTAGHAGSADVVQLAGGLGDRAGQRRVDGERATPPGRR